MFQLSVSVQSIKITLSSFFVLHSSELMNSKRFLLGSKARPIVPDFTIFVYGSSCYFSISVYGSSCNFTISVYDSSCNFTISVYDSSSNFTISVYGSSCNFTISVYGSSCNYLFFCHMLSSFLFSICSPWGCQ